MKTILACAGVYGDDTALKSLVKIARERRPDGVLFAGGIISPDPGLPHRTDFMARFFEMMNSCGRLVAIIPGPWDTPQREFFRAALNAEVVYERVYVVHATPFIRGDVAISGIGGFITESEEASEPVLKYSHASAEYFLRRLWDINKPVRILLLSEPTVGRLGGAKGNPIVREFISSYHPSICIAAGSRQHRGFEQDSHTLVVNPGLLTEGSAAWIERLAPKVEMLDF